jgi:hypothetical protein
LFVVGQPRAPARTTKQYPTQCVLSEGAFHGPASTAIAIDDDVAKRCRGASSSNPEAVTIALCAAAVHPFGIRKVIDVTPITANHKSGRHKPRIAPIAFIRIKPGEKTVPI